MTSSLRIAGIARPADIAFTFQGERITAPAGESLAAALLAAGIRHLGDGPNAPRAAFCMMGVCQQCLVRLEGQLVQACLTPVRDGMRVTPA
ncbi:(2Fe-2S)-binding protein [Sediminicoccus sp. KRV36]|uniref:(2Fe-2S)-binding protein n=1 Tax=Sediminicoccus sp. KRV36 TaxID=3133721 RepID=UPI002010954B|nr:(2Fe-2S)-binding protein [Sediminicoccus rosea]UPY37325.1 (2Fe-2S)-binding protein [Sediminicoccus rosea]